ncbi:hypothetical protein JW948_03090 [bacterium]|nr:hypothetical protein [bacterium]
MLKNISNTTNEKRNIGVGFMIGEPIGFNVKWWRNKSIDLESAIEHYEFYLRSWLLSNTSWLPIKDAWVASVAYPVFHDGFLHIHLDHIWHKYIESVDEVGIISVYYGCGGRIRFADDNVFGIRGVLGTGIYSESFPVDVFCEIAPIFDMIPGSGLDLNVDAGIRFYFR